MRRFHATAAGFCVCIPEHASVQQLRLERWRQRLRQHHHTVLATLALAHHDNPTIKVHILDAKAKTFHQSHAGAIQQLGQ
jgi:hypothetical protein